MITYFPDFDGILNFHDGHVGGQCNTLPIIGKKYYDRFGYIYHPSYKSLYCDNELTLISYLSGKEYISNQVLIRHNHPIYNDSGVEWDALYYKNERYGSLDRATFNMRQKQYFDVAYLDLQNNNLIDEIRKQGITPMLQDVQVHKKDLLHQVSKQNRQAAINKIRKNRHR